MERVTHIPPKTIHSGSGSVGWKAVGDKRVLRPCPLHLFDTFPIFLCNIRYSGSTAPTTLDGTTDKALAREGCLVTGRSGMRHTEHRVSSAPGRGIQSGVGSEWLTSRSTDHN